MSAQPIVPVTKKRGAARLSQAVKLRETATGRWTGRRTEIVNVIAIETEIVTGAGTVTETETEAETGTESVTGTETGTGKLPFAVSCSLAFIPVLLLFIVCQTV